MHRSSATEPAQQRSLEFEGSGRGEPPKRLTGDIIGMYIFITLVVGIPITLMTGAFFAMLAERILEAI